MAEQPDTDEAMDLLPEEEEEEEEGTDFPSGLGRAGSHDAAQAHMGDRTILDPEIISLAEEVKEHEEAGKAYASAKKRLSAAVLSKNYEAGRYRVGETERVINVKDLHGGDMTIPPWEAKSVTVE